jgi:flavin reductase (DIM6/NTAB) family NADH-FMN oxidoreductase RutF
VADVMLSYYKPLHKVFSCYKKHHSTPAIKEHKTFSINIPSEENMEKEDFCGIVSGKEVNKSKKFEIFYGKQDRTALIEEIPVSKACDLKKNLRYGKYP